MAGSFTNWLEAAVLDTLFGSNSTEISTGHFTNLYIGLFESTAVATVDDTWTALSTGECAGSTYSRKEVTNSSDTWCNATGGTKELKAAITFTTSAGSDWGAVGGFGIFDTANTSAGNMLCWSTLTGGAKTINSGDTISITTALTVTLS